MPKPSGSDLSSIFLFELAYNLLITIRAAIATELDFALSVKAEHPRVRPMVASWLPSSQADSCPTTLAPHNQLAPSRGTVTRHHEIHSSGWWRTIGTRFVTCIVSCCSPNPTGNPGGPTGDVGLCETRDIPRMMWGGGVSGGQEAV